MTNENLKDTLTSSLEKAKADEKVEQDIELTDTDLDDVAGGACAGYCNTFSPA